jgi:uncharacterized protein (DUF362 family)
VWNVPRRRVTWTDATFYSEWGTVAATLGLTGACSRKSSTPRASADSVGQAQHGESVIVRARGTDYGAMTKAAVERLGGMSKFVSPGAKVVVKPNVGWDRPISVCANSRTDVVRAVIEMVQNAGASDVRIVDHPVAGQHPIRAFDVSGMTEVANQTGVEAYPVYERKGFVAIDLPDGLMLKNAEVIREVLEADVVINVPVAKSHVCTKFTGALKNWMGIVYDRRFFHHSFLTDSRTSPEHWNHIAQCIADIQFKVRPTITIMDATAIMKTNGPAGPGELEEKNEILASEDVVAIDTYAVALFDNIALEDVWSINRAAQLGLGVMDLSKVQMRDVA